MLAPSVRLWGDGRPVMPSLLATVLRRTVRMPPVLTPGLRNVRPVENFSRHEAPDPIRQGDTPARPSRMPIVTFRSDAAIRAVMNDDFYIGIIAPYPGAQTLGGRQAPWNERLNIHRNSAEAYGSLLTLTPTDSWEGPW